LVLVDADGRAVRAVPAQPAEGGDIAPGHLRSPTSLAVSGEGMIYVADTGNHRVQRFSMQLEPAPFAAGSSCIGRIDATGCPAAGAGNGEFTAPSLVAVCPGLFCVADATGRLQTFAADGRHLRTVDLQLKDACGLAVEPDGSVYVARAGSNRIVKYDAAGKPAPAFGAEGVATLECSEVLSLAAAGGRLFACCRQPDAVAVLDAAGKQAGILGLPPAAGGPGMPAGIDVDSQGGIFLADAWAQRVVRLSQSGEVLWSVPDARQPVDLERPVDVVLQPGGGLCVLDGGAGRRILVLDVLGRPQQGFGGGGVLQSDELKKAVMIDADDRGGVWAGDAERGVLFDAGGNALMWSLPPPWAKATAGGITYVPLQEAGESFIVIRDGAGRELARKGGTGSGVASLGGCRPGGLAAAAGGPGKPDRIYYADAANRRIAVFRAEWSSISRAFRER